MKKLSLLLISLLLFSTSLVADTTSVHSSTYVEPETVDGIDPNNLTDTQKQINENYIHDGLSQEQMDEACVGNEDACAGDAAYAIGETEDQIVAAVSKMTALIFVTGGGKVDITPKQVKGADPVEKKEMNDYCKYIAVGGEAVATFKQTADQANIESDIQTVTVQTENTLAVENPDGTSSVEAGTHAVTFTTESKQKELLYAAARSHESREDSAKIQTYTWGGTAACYVGMIAYSASTGGAAGGTAESVGLKLAAATGLAAFYGKLSGEHGNYADKVKEIASGLPGKGDCNPITNVNCYCAQESTKNDPSYCATGLNDQELEAGDVRITCVNNNLKADPSCSCIDTNTCIDKKFTTSLSNFGMPSASTASGLDVVESMSSGRVLSGDLAAATIGNAAKNNKNLNEATKNFKPVSLTEDQEKEAKVYEDFGIPANVASQLAATKVPQSDINKYKSTIRESMSNKEVPAVTEAKTKALRYSGGKGVSASKTTKKKSNFNPFAKLAKKQVKESGQEVLRFQQKAMKNADINTDSSKSIFDMISNRYQTSGIKRLSQ